LGSLAGGYNEGSHASYSVERLGGGTLFGINSQSGGFFGTQATSAEAGGPFGTTQESESGGAGSTGRSHSGGALPNGGESESSMQPLWNSLQYNQFTAGATSNGTGNTTSDATQELSKGTQVSAHVPVMVVKTYNWNDHRREGARYAYRSAHSM